MDFLDVGQLNILVNVKGNGSVLFGYRFQIVPVRFAWGTEELMKLAE